MISSQIFAAIGLATVVTGGILAAASASHLTVFRVWASGYLVLVAGLIQFGLASGWRQLGAPNMGLAIAAFIIYNIANFLVIYGTARKWRKLAYASATNVGGGLLAVAMLLLIVATRSAAITSWTFIWFLALEVVILVAMPLGLRMSAVRHRQH